MNVSKSSVAKKLFLSSALATAIAASHSVHASDLICAGGQLTVDLTVNEGENCSIVEEISLNGTVFRTEFQLNNSLLKLITIENGTAVVATVQQSCLLVVENISKTITLNLESAAGCGVDEENDEEIDEEDNVDDGDEEGGDNDDVADEDAPDVEVVEDIYTDPDYIVVEEGDDQDEDEDEDGDQDADDDADDGNEEDDGDEEDDGNEEDDGDEEDDGNDENDGDGEDDGNDGDDADDEENDQDEADDGEDVDNPDEDDAKEDAREKKRERMAKFRERFREMFERGAERQRGFMERNRQN